MDTNQFHRRIREVVIDENLPGWVSASDKQAYCRELLGPLNEHEVVISILTEVIDELLQRKAEDKYAIYKKGSGVSILESGHCIPATVIENRNDDTLIVQIDSVFKDGSFKPNLEGDTITFQRAHDHVYIHLEGRKLSRLVPGKRFLDYSIEHIEEELKILSQPQLAS